MFRSFKVLASFSAFAALVACGGSAADGMPGKSALSSLTPEPAGADCPAGGTRVATGLDLDGDGVLDTSEVKSSQLLCNGKDAAGGKDGSGPSSLLAIDAEPQGANCAGGGTRVQSGIDTDGNRLLEPSEVTSTRYICSGAQGSATEAVSVYDAGTVNVGSPTPVTVLSAKLDAPGKGKVVALSNADVFCASPAIGQGHDCAGSGTTRGYFTLSTTAAAASDSGNYDYFYVSPNSTENAARTAVFDVAAAGEVNVYLRASASSGQYGFFRSSLTLLFIPE